MARRRQSARLWGALCGVMLLAGAARGQGLSGLNVAFVEGVRAVEAGAYEAAVMPLAAVFREAPGFFVPGRGSAAYWLGRAYRSAGKPAAAVDVWARGWEALTEARRIDLKLADALIAQTFARKDTLHYAVAASAYLTLLEHLDGDLPEDLRPIRTRALVPLALILPDSLREATGLTDAEAAAGARLPEGAGARLSAWWRSMDPLPATPENERLLEHLERVAHATKTFGHALAPLGFDDRAKIYIRLGAPARTTAVMIDQNEPLHATLDDPLAPFYPEGEFWVYDHVDDTAQYLFVRERGLPFRLGRPVDLVPPSLRGRRSSLRLMASMMDIYRMLALYHPKGHYGSAYEQIENYLGLLEDYALAGTQRSPAGTYRATPPAPAATVFSTLSRTRAEDRRAIRSREARVPAAYTNVFDDVDLLPVEVRWARFLDPDGTTRTEVYWGLKTRDLAPSEKLEKRLEKDGFTPTGQYLIEMTALRQTGDFRARDRRVARRMVADAGGDETAVIPAQTFVARGDTGRYGLALQWDVFWSSVGAAVARGPKLKVGAYRIGAVEALPSDPARLEMSDLKPLRLFNPAQSLDEAAPYPHDALTPEISFGLYFEVYHLLFGADDRAHFTVAYEVVRRGKNGDRDRRITATTPYTSDHRTARETIFLDLRKLHEEGRFEVAVHVTDDTTGRTVTRMLTFDVRK